jgi:hypothetical protein
MFKSIKAIASSIILTVLIFSCGKETQSSTQGGGLFKYRVTITPPLHYGATGQFKNQSNYLQVGVIPIASSYIWDGKQLSDDFTTYESQEYSVTQGQNITFTYFIDNSYDLVCRTVKIEALINGNVFKTVTQEKGYSSISPMIKCKDFDAPAINFIMP